jgi:ketosteroid isomerase-like protein
LVVDRANSAHDCRIKIREKEAVSSLETRIQLLEDRMALQDVLTAFCNAVDSLSDMNGLLNCFTADAVFDLSGINLPRFDGRDAIRGFFAQVFADMSHHAHCASNFTIDRLSDTGATCRAAVIGTGATKDGRSVLVYVRYFLEYSRMTEGWKIKRLSEAALMPLPGSLTAIHGRN